MTKTTLSADDLLIHGALGATATYRVIAVAGPVVSVAVLSAPGLQPGTQLRFTRAAAQAMACETARVRRTAHPRRRRAFSARLRPAR
jgi:hypothetical protein